jgi:uncharacterized protein YegL
MSDDAPTPHTHLYLLLDRSGSMSSMGTQVVEGINHLIAEQQADGGDALMTLVQFDTHDHQETIFDAVPIRELVPMGIADFQPRGGTPLLDALGILVGRATNRIAERAAAGLPAEEILFVALTDGQENASHEFTLDAIRATVDQRQADGWSFVFMGADLSVYAEATQMGFDSRSTIAFAGDAVGVTDAMANLSRKAVDRRQRQRSGAVLDKADFFEGDKSAEDDRERRRGDRG